MEATRADARFGARTLLGGAALALAAIPFGLLAVLVETRWSPLLELDAAARDGLHTFAVGHDWFVTLMRAFSLLAAAPVYSVLFGALASWLWLGARRPRLAAFVAVTVAGSGVLNRTVKAAVDRARPVLDEPVAHAGGLSFPSGHAQAAVVTTGVLLVVFGPALHGRARRAAVAVAAAVVVAVGFSRVALGVHFVSDVLGGYVLGAAWVALTTAAFGAWRGERHRHALTARAACGASRSPER